MLQMRAGGRQAVVRISSFEAGRLLHRAQRIERLQREREFLSRNWAGLIGYFADGRDVQPHCIEPRLEIVRQQTWQSDLFRFAALTWSVPVSQGYGRRLRFLVWDNSNGKLIGLIALGDPVFNLSARDRLVGWTAQERMQRLVNVMDAYVLGAVPPYNRVLGGKLVASLVRTVDVRLAFQAQYGVAKGIISGQTKRADLLLVTTSSALGRSSLYNRLRLDGTLIFEPIGYTQGWGHFHLPEDLFADLRALLKRSGHKYANGNRFGDGPNWKLRTAREALKRLGMSPGLLRHGISREVFACRFADNAGEVLRGERKRPIFRTLKTADEMARLARDRWVIPRAGRDPSYRGWDRSNLVDLFFGVSVPTAQGRPCLAAQRG